MVLVGILGCGRAAEGLHLPALARLPEARLTAAYDPKAERRSLIARAATGCRAFASAEELLSARVVDAVIVASPPETHAALAALALRARVPVLLETPLAGSLDDAACLRAEERAAGLPVMVGFNRRWWASAQALHRTLASGAIHAPVSVETILVGDAGRPGTAAPAGDPLDDLAPHHMDLLRYIVGQEIRTVRASRGEPHEIVLELGFHGGGSARSRLRFGDRREERFALETGGARYLIHAGSGRHRPAEGPAQHVLDLAHLARRRLFGRQDSLADSYRQQLRAFVSAVRGEGPPIPGTTDGVAALQATEAARVSLEYDGEEIEVLPTPTA